MKEIKVPLLHVLVGSGLSFTLALAFIGSTQKDLEQSQSELQQYQYATQYLVEHHEDYLLEFCLDGMSEAIKKGFIQSQPPKLVML